MLLLLCCAGCGSKQLPLTSDAPSSATGSSIARTACAQVGRHYRSGGASPRAGFDCSGLVWWSYKAHGIRVPRITTDQARAGWAVSAPRPGDIVVFRIGNSPRGLHTGLYSGNGRFVHSPRPGKSVRVENLHAAHWRKYLVGVRRIVR